MGILHWLYLGIGKHLLKACIQELPEMKQEQLCMLIESCDQSAFGTKVSRDTIIYIDSRQGKDIKTYVRTHSKWWIPFYQLNDNFVSIVYLH